MVLPPGGSLCAPSAVGAPHQSTPASMGHLACTPPGTFRRPDQTLFPATQTIGLPASASRAATLRLWLGGKESRASREGLMALGGEGPILSCHHEREGHHEQAQSPPSSPWPSPLTAAHERVAASPLLVVARRRTLSTLGRTRAQRPAHPTRRGSSRFISVRGSGIEAASGPRSPSTPPLDTQCAGLMFRLRPRYPEFMPLYKKASSAQHHTPAGGPPGFHMEARAASCYLWMAGWTSLPCPHQSWRGRGSTIGRLETGATVKGLPASAGELGSPLGDRPHPVSPWSRSSRPGTSRFVPSALVNSGSPRRAMRDAILALQGPASRGAESPARWSDTEASHETRTRLPPSETVLARAQAPMPPRLRLGPLRRFLHGADEYPAAPRRFDGPGPGA